MPLASLRTPRIFVLLPLFLLAGCATGGPDMDNNDISENGSLLIVPAPVSEVNDLLHGLVKEWKLVAARDLDSPSGGQFDFSTTISAATITTSEAGQGSTRVSVYPGTMVTSGSATQPANQSVHAADPRFALNLQHDVVGRLEDTYHVKAIGTADSTTQRVLNGK